MTPEYVIELLNSDASFGPNQLIGEVWGARNLGWSRYDRLPGKAFFTLGQESPLLPLLTPLTTHIRIHRLTPNATTRVYAGAFIDYDATGDDVICSCFDYEALLSISRSGYKTMYPKKKLGTEIVSPEWALAKAAVSSPLGFVTTGTIQDPLGTDGVTPITTNNQFGLLDQMRLALFYDLSEMGRANTVNQVGYEITRTSPHTFLFYKNRGSARDLAFILGGNVTDYRHLPNWTGYRNDLATIGTTTAGGATEVIVKDDAAAAALGRRQDVFTLKTLAGIVGKATEADQQRAASERMLKSAVSRNPALLLRLMPGTFDPFVGHDIDDTFPIEISNGIDSIAARWRLVGERALVGEGGEAVSVLVSPVLT